MTDYALFAAAWLLTGISIWVVLVVQSQRLTVGDLLAVPLWMLVGPIGLIFLSIVSLMTSDKHIITDWSKW